MTTSGTSAIGFQNLLTASSSPSLLMSLVVGPTFTPPPYRVGYFYLYMFNTTTPFQSYLVQREPIYRPGILLPIRTQLLSTGYAWRLDAFWDKAGLAWTANIA